MPHPEDIRSHLLTPGDAPPALLARRTAVRLERIRKVFAQPRLRRIAPDSPYCLDSLAEGLGTLRRDRRDALLCGPDIRGFLAGAETWTRAVRLTTGSGGPELALFDLVSGTEHLVRLLPDGRVDPGFPARVARFARLRLRQIIADLAAFTIGLRIASPCDRRITLSLEFREDAEQGRPSDRIDLGCVVTPAGPLGIVADRPRTRAAGRMPARVHATLIRRTLALQAPGAGRSVVPAAGSRLRCDENRGRGGRRRGGLQLMVREMIPGTSILLAPMVVSRPERLSVGGDVVGLGERLARALRLVLIAWPDAHAEILSRTRMVVPVREKRLVSYSLASRPGISYINVHGKSLVDLADDLLHETAHHRLHDIQEIRRLTRSGPETMEAQAFDSPWRGTRRPLHGLLHGSYTFPFRAELFARLLRAARRHPRVFSGDIRPPGLTWIGRELRREIASIDRALRDLDVAARAGLFTSAGRDLLRRLRAWRAGHRR